MKITKNSIRQILQILPFSVEFNQEKLEWHIREDM